MSLKEVEPESAKPEETPKIEEDKKVSEAKPEESAEPKQESAPAKEDKQEPVATTETPKAGPPLPQRKPDLFGSNLEELKQAFPNSDSSVCRGILVAASNDLEHAFQGMLAISDDTIRPIAKVSKEQLLHDEKVARDLLMKEQKRASRSRAQQNRSSREQVRDMYDEENEEFLDTVQKGFEDTKQAVSSFWGSLKQKLANEIGDDEMPPQQRPMRTSNDRRDPPWFPKDNGYHLEPRSEQNRPVLPPRRTNTEEKSVNAFGDDLETKAAKPKNEPSADSDAFFIGESEDEDLNESKANDTAKPASNEEAKEPKEPKEEAKEAKAESKEESKDDKSEENKSSAKDLLNKVKETK